MQKLNPAAEPFFPSSYGSCASAEPDLENEEYITQEELDELEAAEEWVATMAGLEEEENMFIIDFALSSAEPARVAEIERSCAKEPAAAAAEQPSS